MSNLSSSYPSYHQALRYLEGLYNLPLDHEYLRDRFDCSIYLKRTEYFLGLLGNPHRGIKYVHVTGTSGKGTVSSMIHGALRNHLKKSGGKVGLVTSPFVQETIEKIKVNDLYISKEEFALIVGEIQPMIDKAYLEGPYGRPSYFEILLAISFLYFKRMKCEWVVLEVGCGGRYDYTNVIDRCEAAVITNIGYDHQEFLGKTLAKIAYEKAGIIKTNCKVFTAEQRPHLLKIFKEECKKKKVLICKIPKTSDYRKSNEMLVGEVCRSLGISNNDIQKGNKARLPARFEIVSQKPFIVLDGAHNESKIKSTIENVGKLPHKRLIVVFGSAENKEYKTMIDHISSIAHHIIFTRSQVVQRRAAQPKELKSLHKGSSEVILDPFRALERARKIARKDDLVLVTGSFYLAGNLREIWYSPEKVLKTRKSF